MTRELYVASTPHETKVALVEDDQLAELFYERENEYTLAGSIYKGRVTRVLPGMQSAFVDLGLERDAFLYVSDFLELPEDEDSEFDDIAVESPEHFVSYPPPEAEPGDGETAARAEFSEGAAKGESASENPEDIAEGNTQQFEPVPANALPDRSREYRGRRRRGMGRRGIPESKFARSARYEGREAEPAFDLGDAGAHARVVLPGESISKYQSASSSEPPPAESPEAAPAPEAAPVILEEEAGSAAPAAIPTVLPGESISKYQNGSQGVQPASSGSLPGESIAKYQDKAQSSGATPETVLREARTEAAPPSVRPRPTPGKFSVLPGESIAKYHRSPETAAPESSGSAVGANAELENPRFRSAENSASFVIESEPWEEDSISKVNLTPSSPPRQESAADATLSHSHSPLEATSAVHEADADNRVAESSNVQVESDEEEMEESTDFSAMESGASDPSSPVITDDSLPDDHLFGAGTLDHEELEGEETEMQPPGEEEGEEDLELEEHSYSREARTPEAAPQASEETAAEDWGMEAGSHDFEEEEISFEEEEVAEKPDEELEREAHAEVRAPSAVAGYARDAGPSPARRRFPREGAPERQEGFRRGERRVFRGRPHHQAQSFERHSVQISDLLKEGQEVLVQISKEPIGKKGARITSHIALPGRFLVYMPTVTHIGVSRKIGSDDERRRLKRIMISEREGGRGGFIVRTAAAGVGEDELRADIRFLKNLWQQIKQRSDESKAPALIYHDLNLVERILRDLVSSEFAQVWVDSEREYEHILNFANRFQPGLVRRVKLYTRDTPLFEQFGLQEEVDKALKSKVWLKSGGYIVINQTEALVAIDVNTGKFVGKTTRLEDTIVKTNVDAIKEIIRQVRLRDLGGIIVIDFIDMDERRNRQRVMQALEEALKADRAPSKVLAFNDFGLVAITRKRVKQSLERTLSTPCPYCTGNGLVKSAVTVCNEIYAELRKLRRQLEESDVVNLRVNPEVAKAIKSDSGKRLQEFEELAGRAVLIKPDPLLHQEQFDFH